MLEKGIVFGSNAFWDLLKDLNRKKSEISKEEKPEPED
jgi:hypothetical protein